MLKLARNKILIEHNIFDELMAKLDELGDTPAMQRGVEAALLASKELVNSKITSAMAKSNLPAGGKYSTGLTEEAINKDMTVEWEGLVASTGIGFNIKKSFRSIYLMYGTPRMPPVKGLKDAVYGKKTKSEIKKLQEAEINKVINRIMEG